MNGGKRKIFAAVISAVVLVVACYLIYRSFTYVSTDDAQVSAHVVMLSSRVGGTIQEVLASENQRVKQGQALARIDGAGYSDAMSEVEAQAASLAARLKEAEVNYKRSIELFGKQAISRERYDAATAAYKDLGGKLKASQAQLDQAKLNVSYTQIQAPQDGVVARRAVEPGQYVPAGQPLFGFVADDERWVTANFKETEIARLVPGRKALIDVDAVPGREFEGEVETLSPSTGAIFSLLPPDNSTGNFTKVVQRIPVRIKFLNLSDADKELLRAGLSAVVEVRVR